VKEFFKSLFGASSKEIIGFSALILILVISLLVPRIINKLTAGNDSFLLEDKKILDSLVVFLEENKANARSKAKAPVDAHLFNPNNASTVELESLGFSRKIAQRIINYRDKGGSFRIKNDLYKIYDIDSALVDRLYNFIDLPQNIVKQSKPEMKEVVSTTRVRTVAIADNRELPNFDINTADTAMLQTIKGIGSVLSNRIIDFRNKLGGFLTEDQLYEVYNLDSAVVLTLMTKMYIDDRFVPEKIRINQADEKEIAGHPYLSWQQARLIIAYRNQHGDYLSDQDLRKVYSVDENDIVRIVSYLDWTRSK